MPEGVVGSIAPPVPLAAPDGAHDHHDEWFVLRATAEDTMSYPSSQYMCVFGLCRARWKLATTAVTATVKLMAAARLGATVPRARSYTDGESKLSCLY